MGWKVGFLIHKSLFLLFANDRLQTQSARYLQSCFFAAMEIERRWERKREAGADAENHLFYASLCVTDKAHRKVMLINRSRDEQSYRPLSSEIEKKKREKRSWEERERLKRGKKVRMTCSWVCVLQSLWGEKHEYLTFICLLWCDNTAIICSPSCCFEPRNYSFFCRTHLFQIFKHGSSQSDEKCPCWNHWL